MIMCMLCDKHQACLLPEQFMSKADHDAALYAKVAELDLASGLAQSKLQKVIDQLNVQIADMSCQIDQLNNAATPSIGTPVPSTGTSLGTKVTSKFGKAPAPAPGATTVLYEDDFLV